MKERKSIYLQSIDLAEGAEHATLRNSWWFRRLSLPHGGLNQSFQNIWIIFKNMDLRTYGWNVQTSNCYKRELSHIADWRWLDSEACIVKRNLFIHTMTKSKYFQTSINHQLYFHRLVFLILDRLIWYWTYYAISWFQTVRRGVMASLALPLGTALAPAQCIFIMAGYSFTREMKVR